MFALDRRTFVRAVRTLALALVTVAALHLVFSATASARTSVPVMCAHEACGIEGCTMNLVNHYCCEKNGGCQTTSCLQDCDG